MRICRRDILKAAFKYHTWIYVGAKVYVQEYDAVVLGRVNVSLRVVGVVPAVIPALYLF